MTWEIIQEIEASVAKLKANLSPAVQADIKKVENAGHDIVHTATDYIKTNGLQDLYQIALVLVSAMVPGASWTATLASVKTQAIADGVKLLEGSESVVAAQAQADLLAAGKSAGLAV